MRSDWVKHDGSGCPAELDGHHRVDIETAVGFMNSVRADKVNWKNVTAWRLLPQEVGRVNPCKCVDCGGTEPSHSNDCEYMLGSIHLDVLDTLADRGASGDAASTALEGGKAMHNTLDKYFSVQETLNARGERYGDFTDNARISQQLKQLIMCESDGKLREGYRRCNFVQREALEMIAQKIARILNGNPNYKDNWHDIQGYARLAEERCKE